MKPDFAKGITRCTTGIEESGSDYWIYQLCLKPPMEQWLSAFPTWEHLNLTRVSDWRDNHTYLEVYANGITVLRRIGTFPHNITS